MSDRDQPTQPSLESDRMLRHTWTWQFDEPERVGLLEEIGDLILGYAREGHQWGGSQELEIVPGSLNAIAADLDSLAGCLEEVAGEPAESTVDQEDLALCRRAETWRDAVRGIVLEIRRGIGTEPGDAGAGAEPSVSRLTEAARRVVEDYRERHKIGRGLLPLLDTLEDALAAFPPEPG